RVKQMEQPEPERDADRSARQLADDQRAFDERRNGGDQDHEERRPEQVRSPKDRPQLAPRTLEERMGLHARSSLLQHSRSKDRSSADVGRSSERALTLASGWLGSNT